MTEKINPLKHVERHPNILTTELADSDAGRQPETPAEYGAFLEQIKHQIQTARTQAALAVNRHLLELYWSIGREIASRQAAHGWGDSVLPRLAKDLQAAFPGVSGFSRRNLYRMRSLYLAYHDRGENVPQIAAQIPWFHNVILLEKIKDSATRDWYAQAAFEHGWSRNVLEMQIESHLYERQGKAVTNFSRTLPPPQSDLAQQILKDPYNFEFLTLQDDAHEPEQDFINRWVQPFYMELPHVQFSPELVSVLVEDCDQVEPLVVTTLLAERNWRHRKVGAWFAGVKNWSQFSEQIGELMLRSEVVYAGKSYAFALACFGSDEAVHYLKRYLNIYLDRPNCWYDQAEALSALLWIDKVRSTNEAIPDLVKAGHWERFVADKMNWNLEKKSLIFFETMRFCRKHFIT